VLIKIPKYEYKEIVLGGTLDALKYSKKKSLPIIINKINLPHRFEEVNGESAIKIWFDLFYYLSLRGLNLLGHKTRQVRIKEEEVVVSTENARIVKFVYEKLFVFDDENVEGLPLPKKENDTFVVLDWMIARSCETHRCETIDTDDLFVNKIYFYPSERMDGHHPNRKDLVSISFLKKEQLNDFEYSDTYARFKVTHLLREKGLKGTKCGGNNQYALKLEVDRREIRKAYMHTYEDTKKIKFK
jgi:hypothetical protein|tara:strand:- start:6459 stop:7187 length:729 start_codon:yes stop_codon:yes gene_type:complete